MRELPRFITTPTPEMYLDASKALVLDFETTNIEKGSALNPDNRIVLAVWRTGHRHHYKWGGEMEQEELVKACNEASFLVAHNAKFELQWLARCGYDIGSRPVYCTLVGEWVLAGNRRWRLGLDECLRRRNMAQKDDLVGSMIKSGACPSDIPRSLLLRYGKQDVNLTHDLFTKQVQELNELDLLPVQYTRCLVIPALADIETNGLHLDAGAVEEVYHETLEHYRATMEELDALTGGINPKSPPQVARYVYGELGFKEKCDNKGQPFRNKPTKQFPDGMPKTDEATLLSLAATTPEQLRFIALKKEQAQLSAALDKNLSMFVGACRENDGMIYAELNQGRTVTHRLSSAGRSTYYKMFDKKKGCQFQNLPRQFKRLFSPRYEGWLFGEVDEAQLEFRIAGHLGNDETIIKEVTEGFDVHSFTRDIINSVDKEKIDRTGAKAHTFKPLYGGESGTKGQKEYYAAFREKYSGLNQQQEEWCAEVACAKKLSLPWGMKFYWPHAAMQESWGKARLNVKTQVYNIAIQSLATADIVPVALACMWHRARDAEMLLVNTVHDSIEAEFPPEERELFEEIACVSMTTDVYLYLWAAYKIKLRCPLAVGMLIGSNWGVPLEGEEEISVQVDIPQLGETHE